MGDGDDQAREVSMPEAPSGEVTALLQNWAKGDTKALDDLIPLVHQELQALARRHLRAERILKEDRLFAAHW